jgi:hypothetical protein
MPLGDIEKNLSLFIKQQFPAIYRESGSELVQLVEDYYKFCETQTNQSIYNQRRMFEHKDIDTTLDSMLIFFKKKYLADLPLKEDNIRFIIKNILDLYRSKGTKRGIELFFAIFYQEFDIEIVYPSDKMAKISDSEWRQGVYLQMFPNDGTFLSKTGKSFTYFDLLSRNITGSTSKAKAAVRSVNFFILNNIKTPVVYLDDIKGNFTKYDDLYSVVNGELVNFGKINGSLSNFEVDTDDKGETGIEVGEVYDVKQKDGHAGTAIVTAISDEITGKVQYTLEDGGYGYQLNNTRLLTSNQSIILNNTEAGYNQGFIQYEVVQDQLGNSGIVIGQNESSVGIRMDGTDAFTFASIVTTVRGSNELTITIASNGQEVTTRNDTSPGPLFPDTSDTADVKVSALINTSIASVITDVISPHTGTVLNTGDWESVAPFSGSASPVNLTTVISDAFDIQDLTIGQIAGFENINPGSNYRNDIFVAVQDNIFKNFDRRSQIIRFTDAGDAGSFSIGDSITEVSVRAIRGRVIDVNQNGGFITVIPFNYYGFDGSDIKLTGSVQSDKAVSGVSADYSPGAKVMGENAVVDAETQFAFGRVKSVKILSSGFGYNDYGKPVDEDPNMAFALGKGSLVNSSGATIATGWISNDTQGVTEGYWAGENSHLSGYIQKGVTSSETILPNDNFAAAVLAIAVGSDPIAAVPALAPEFQNWLSSTASDGFQYGDIDKSGSITSADALEFSKIPLGTALVPSVTRWDDIISPNLQGRAWYKAQENIIWVTDVETNVYDQEYYDAGVRIQDSDYFQEYSYQIKSSLPLQTYEELLKQNVHLAGSKLFGDFIFKAEVGSTIKPRFLRMFNDDGGGSPLDIANTDLLEASVTNFTVDSTFISADHEPV